MVLREAGCVSAEVDLGGNIGNANGGERFDIEIFAITAAFYVVECLIEVIIQSVNAAMSRRDAGRVALGVDVARSSGNKA